MSLLGKWITWVIHTDAQATDPLKVLDEKVYDTRVAFEAAVKHAAEKAKVPDAADVAQSVTGYVFDFGDMDFGLHTTKAMKAAVEERLKLVFLEVDIPPEIITNCLVHRAWRQGRTGNRFEPHMISLFKLAIAIVGKRAAPAGEGLFSVHADTFKALCEIKVPDLDVARYLTNREKADAAHLAAAEEAATAAEAPVAESEGSGLAADASTAGPTESGSSATEPGAVAGGQGGTGGPSPEEATPAADPWTNNNPFAKAPAAAKTPAPAPMAAPAIKGSPSAS